MIKERGNSGLFMGVDWISVLIYIVLLSIGLFTIFAAVYNESHSSIFDFSQQYGAQIIWIGVSSVVAIFILLLDVRYLEIFAYPIYILTILTLIAVLLFGREVNGARAWFEIGSFRVQPAEFAKFATGLAIASYISNYHFSFKKVGKMVLLFAIAFFPAVLILLQNDTGSALVYSAFFVVLFREGFPLWIFILLIVIITLFVLSFIVEPWLLMFVLYTFLVTIFSIQRNNWRIGVAYFGLTMLLLTLSHITLTILNIQIDQEYLLLASVIATTPLVIFYVIKEQMKFIIKYILLFFISSTLLLSVDFIFNEVLKIHQQKRILDTLGLVDDSRGWGYNVNQSKIAIGSGGLLGKGYLNGTQTRYDFVPEQSTDFIFCTIGEERGFAGSILIIILFIVLIIRLMRMGDNQKESFGRVYCYFAASVFLFHMVVNIGMTIGILPVIGIPLPFFSYGGSSLIAFTILLFIAIKINCKKEEKRNF